MKILNIIINFLLISTGILILIYGLTHTKTEIQRRDELLKQGYPSQQVDSIIDKEDHDMTYAILHLAG